MFRVENTVTPAKMSTELVAAVRCEIKLDFRRYVSVSYVLITAEWDVEKRRDFTTFWMLLSWFPRKLPSLMYILKQAQVFLSGVM